MAKSLKEEAVKLRQNIDNVYETGKQSEYDRFWDTFQQNGTRTTYIASFCCGWTPEIFKPKYPLRPIQAYQMFYNNGGENLLIKDFVEFCKDNNVILDFSNCVQAAYGLATLKTHHFGVLDFSKCTGLYDLFYTHGNINGVVTIDEFISSETTVFNANTFQSATYLTNIKMSGVIACDINFSKNTRLTVESMKSIISCLKNFSGTTNELRYIVKFSTTCWAALEADSTSPNGTTWEEYVQNLGWNI